MNTTAPAVRTLEEFAHRFRDKTTRRILILRPSTDWPARWKADSNLYAPTQIACMRGRILSITRFGHHNRLWALKVVDQ